MSAGSGRKYYPALDTLRALAVATVLAAHFSPTAGQWINGCIGVQLFFVLSGFLITGILLQGRSRVDAGESTVLGEWKVFFLRRTLRIFPLYYGVLALALILNLDGVRAVAVWLFTYCYNFRIWGVAGWPDRLVSHFWSLAVEEQFYLFWPWVVLCAPRRFLPWAIAGMFPLGVICRWELSRGHAGATLASLVLLPPCCEYLGVGALLAWARFQGWMSSPRATMLVNVPFVATLISFAISIAQMTRGAPLPRFDAPNAVFFGLLVHLCAGGIPGFMRRVLEWSVTVYLGRISYGIYVIHNFMHDVGPGLSRRLFGVRFFPREWEHVAWLTACTVAAAALSYHFYERPWQGLKRRWTPATAKTPPFNLVDAGPPMNEDSPIR